MGKRGYKWVERVRIVDIADKGKAIGKDDEGIVYLLEKVVPGDVVSLKYKRSRKGVRIGYIERIIEHSPLRVDPTCEHFGTCGGCKWQHLDYNSQLQFKHKIVRDCFERIADLNPSVILPIIACDPPFEYRNKLEYSFSSQRWLTDAEVRSGEPIEDQRALGFHAPGYYDKIVHIRNCHLQKEPSNRIRNHLYDFSIKNEFNFYNFKHQNGLLRNLIIRTTSRGDCMVILVFGEEKHEAIELVLNELRKQFHEITSLYYVVNTKKNDSIHDLEMKHFAGNKYVSESLLGTIFKIGPSSFFQTNTGQAEIMMNEILRLADISGDEVIYDLYCGIGAIGLLLAPYCAQMIGVEEVEEAIGFAKINARENSIENVRFLAEDVGIFLKKEIQYSAEPNTIVVDPPRAGMHTFVLQSILELRPEKIIYISCNPATQARDISQLKQIYDLQICQPIDMFPHTNHVENIALLKIRNG